MTKTKLPEAAPIRETDFAEALSERYLAYAMSTIMSRSLPDVRDGLKPVHRRLLYAMHELRLDPGQGFKKCARVVGDVMGKYHPHGDAAIYDALVRLAQEFAVRYPLIEGQGNFGNIDGDSAAAMRYTEARMTEVAKALLAGIDEDTVDFRATYSGEEDEPLVLPAAFPNLLANGATGIAVGMATSIPPHNVGEICSALLHLIKTPNARIETLVDHMPGPDFPTGGILVEDRDAVVDAYRTGRGAFRVRARWKIEKLPQGLYQVVVTEIPYQVQKSKLIEKIAELIASRKLGLLDDIRDESAEDVRLVLVPKSRNVEADLLMEQLFRLTDLETRFGLNMNVLDAEQVPRVMDLREVLQAFLDHRHVVLVRRTEHRLERIARRLEVLDGYLAAYLNLDEVIRIIREEDEPKTELITAFELTEVQADAILNMRLRALRKLEEMEIRKEHKALKAEQKSLRALLKDERKQFGSTVPVGARRTEIGNAPTPVDMPLEAMVVREPITVICSEKGWIRATKGHLEDTEGLKFKDGDRGRFALHAETTDKLLIFGTNGRFYTLGCDKLPGGRGHGEPVRLMIGLGNEDDIVDMLVHKPGRRLLVAALSGRGFVVAEDEVVAATRNGKQVQNVSAGDEAAALAVVPENADHVAVIGNNRKLLIFPLKELPEMTRGRGVILQRYKDGQLNDIKAFRLKEGLTWQAGRQGTRTETDLKPWRGERAQAGRMAPRGFNANNRFTS